MGGEWYNKKVSFKVVKKMLGEEYCVLMGWMLEDLVEDWRCNLKTYAPELTLVVTGGE